MSLTEGGVALLPLMNAEGLNLGHKRVPQPCHGWKTEFYNTPLHLMALTYFFMLGMFPELGGSDTDVAFSPAG